MHAVSGIAGEFITSFRLSGGFRIPATETSPTKSHTDRGVDTVSPMLPKSEGQVSMIVGESTVVDEA